MEKAGQALTGIVYKNMKRTGRCGEPGRAVRVSEIGLQHRRLAAACANGRRDIVCGGFLCAKMYDHLGPSLAEGERDCPPDAARGTGNEGALAMQAPDRREIWLMRVSSESLRVCVGPLRIGCRLSLCPMIRRQYRHRLAR